MGFLDKIKNYVTGGAAKVTLELPAIGFPSMPISVKVHTTAEADFKCEGLYIDITATENLSFRPSGADQDVSSSASTFSHSVKIAEGFGLEKGQSKEFTGVVTLPKEAQPTYAGKHGKHTWHFQARLEAKGNDPDSGWKELRVGAMS